MAHLPTYRRAARLAAFALLALPGLLFASGRAFNALVVVNTNSADSVELGEHYAAAHGIPPHHLFRVGLDTNWASLSSNQFHSLLRDPIQAHVSAENLDGQIDFVVLCQEFPTRIRDVEGVAAALFYGFKNAPGHYDPPAHACKLPAYTSNAYYRAERAFRSADGWNGTNGFVAFHLVASNLATAKLVADRGAAAQGQRPPATFNLHLFGDEFRGIRERRFANAQFSFSTLPNLPASCSIAPRYAIMSGITNAMGYQDGYGNVFDPILDNLRTNNVWLPGAYADHLTSYGGAITNLTNAYGQSTVLDWMEIGATASYGTVDEPCAYLEKFPDPLMAFHYARGFTIGEAYAMAVEAPYQGLFAGDPLAAPFAAPPTLAVVSHVPGQIVTGLVSVSVSSQAHPDGAPPASLDLYLGGRFHATLASIAPTPGNVLSIGVNGATSSVAVAASDSLFDAVSALADAINAETNHAVRASARGDRIELIYQPFDRAGDFAPISVAAQPGGSEPLTIGAGSASPHLIPSLHPARKRLFLTATPYQNGANAGDFVSCTITLTNGAVASNVVVAVQGESVRSLLNRLMDDVNDHPALAGPDGVEYDRLSRTEDYVWQSGTLFARSPGPEGAGILVDFSVGAVSNGSGLSTNYNFSSLLLDNPDDVRPRASILFRVVPTNGTLDVDAPLDTSLLPDGLHVLDFVARDGTAVAAASRHSFPLVVCNAWPQLAVRGTNDAFIADGEPPSSDNGSIFGPVEVGSAATNWFSILNNGSADLNLAGWTTQGPGAAAFQLLYAPAVVAVGGISNFAVVFAPEAAGEFAAAFSFDSDAVLPQTNLLFAGTGFALRALEVQSAHGTASPPVGTHTNLHGAVLTNSVAAPTPSGGTQYACVGWAMVGNDPATGSASVFSMTVTNDATLAWLWTTNYWLETDAGPNGSVDLASAWFPAGSTAQVQALPNPHFEFSGWSGDAAGSQNPLDLAMDGPKSIHAAFVPLLATNAVPHWWLAQHGWTNDFDAAALADPDEDGYPTWQEYVADTDPNDPDSFFPPLAVADADAAWELRIDPPSTGRFYFVDVAILLEAAAWSNAASAPGTGSAWSFEIPPAASPARFFRSRVTLPPQE